MGQGEFEIEISPAGKVTVRTKGIKGEACLDYAELFAQILGRQESLEKTSEYYETGVTVQGRADVHQRR
jgi:hypothetical protein